MSSLPTGKRIFALVPALVLVTIAWWSIVRTRQAASSVPGDDAWRALRAQIAGKIQPGDLLVFAPSWIDPVGRLHFGAFLDEHKLGRLDAARYERIWRIEIGGSEAPETVGKSPIETYEQGGVTASLFAQTATTVVTDFNAEFLRSGAKVTGAVARGPSVELAEVGFAPLRCLQVVPLPNGQVRVEFARVELGTTLAIRGGLADVFARRDIRDPGELAIEIDGKVIASKRFGVEDGAVRLDVTTSPNPAATVAFVASAIGNQARDRLICFAAEARK